ASILDFLLRSPQRSWSLVFPTTSCGGRRHLRGCSPDDDEAWSILVSNLGLLHAAIRGPLLVVSPSGRGKLSLKQYGPALEPAVHSHQSLPVQEISLDEVAPCHRVTGRAETTHADRRRIIAAARAQQSDRRVASGCSGRCCTNASPSREADDPSGTRAGRAPPTWALRSCPARTSTAARRESHDTTGSSPRRRFRSADRA